MRNTLLALLLSFVALPAPPPQALEPQAAPPRAASSGAAVPAQAAAPAATSAKIWEGHNQEFETFISQAPIERFESVPIGVTHPKRAYFQAGGLAASVAWKVLPPGRPAGYWESYKSEIAAYELDKLLGMNMVPVAVERRWKSETAAAILWLTPVRQWKDVQARPKPDKFSRQAIIMKMFDNLICNKDRNMGNLLVDDDWNLFLIDHSRAFIDSKDLPVPMVHIDHDLWTRMLALDETSVTAAIGKWVDRAGIRALIARRDRMKTAIDDLVKKSGEASVFTR
jgi:hypothetical protein